MMNDEQEWNGNVQINKNILSFTENVFFGLTMKQVIAGALTIVICLVAYGIFSKIAPDFAMAVSVIIAIPVAAFGFVEYNGMSFGELLKALIQMYGTPPKIFYCSKVKRYYKENSKKKDKEKNKKKGKKK